MGVVAAAQLPQQLQHTVLRRLRETLVASGAVVPDWDKHEGAYHAAIARVTEKLPRLQECACRRLAELCAAQLAPVRGIKTVYRHTNKDMPTMPSVYTADVFTPLRTFLASPACAALSPAARSAWSVAAADRVLHAFHTIAAEELDTVRKAEDSLLRLRKARRAAGGMADGDQGSAISDVDKIHRQLQLDAQQLSHTVRLYAGPRPSRCVAAAAATPAAAALLLGSLTPVGQRHLAAHRTQLTAMDVDATGSEALRKLSDWIEMSLERTGGAP